MYGHDEDNIVVWSGNVSVSSFDLDTSRATWIVRRKHNGVQSTPGTVN